MTSTITFPTSQAYPSLSANTQSTRAVAHKPAINQKMPPQPVKFGTSTMGKRNSRWHRIQKKFKNKCLDLYEDSRDWFKEFFSIIRSDVKNFSKWITRTLR